MGIGATRATRATLVVLVSLMVLATAGCMDSYERVSGRPETVVARQDPDNDLAHRRFRKGLNEFCAAAFRDQLQVTEANPWPDRTTQRRVATEVATRWGRLLGRLDRLRAPADLSSSFHDFRFRIEDVVEGRRSLSTAPSDREYDRLNDLYVMALRRMRALGSNMGATMCDGGLPPDQSREVVAAVRRFVLATDPAQACDRLVTGTYLGWQYAAAGDRAGACAADRAAWRTQPSLRPTKVRVERVFGVDGMTATVRFRALHTEPRKRPVLVGVAGTRPAPLAIRLLRSQERWLVRSVYVDRSRTQRGDY